MVLVDAPRTTPEIALAVVAVCCLAFELVRTARDRWDDRPGLDAGGHGLVSLALVLQSIRLTGLGPAFGYAATVRALADLGILLAGLGVLSMWCSNRTKPSTDRTSEMDRS
ncbi:hypothetical protein [Halococcus hamelinensis]|uniref:hypothetical protein n=1 Tax=Halococcus hamelinensis TaxID=332168 RepID=UPI000AD05A36|nr:hypothetical protein [Halococcus hamelinensis]